MNYLVYDENMRMLGRKNTCEEAIAAGKKWSFDWMMNGCRNARHFTVYYNGHTSQLQYDSRNPNPVTA